eukprot:m.27181 g.27181  ORF g.27181 m.27181 type:complete len:997 (+) comp4381_c0_seq1:42-3032(+)
MQRTQHVDKAAGWMMAALLTLALTPAAVGIAVSLPANVLTDGARGNDTVSIRWQFESQETITELVSIGLLTTAGCTSGVRQAVFQGSTDVPMFHTVTLSATHQFEWRVPNTVFLSPEYFIVVTSSTSRFDNCITPDEAASNGIAFGISQAIQLLSSPADPQQFIWPVDESAQGVALFPVTIDLAGTYVIEATGLRGQTFNPPHTYAYHMTIEGSITNFSNCVVNQTCWTAAPCGDSRTTSTHPWLNTGNILTNNASAWIAWQVDTFADACSGAANGPAPNAAGSPIVRPPPPPLNTNASVAGASTSSPRLTGTVAQTPVRYTDSDVTIRVVVRLVDLNATSTSVCFGTNGCGEAADSVSTGARQLASRPCRIHRPPTLAPTAVPTTATTTASPSVSSPPVAAIAPTIAPTVAPTVAPSHSPTTTPAQPTVGTTSLPPSSPSVATTTTAPTPTPTTQPSHTPTQSPTAIVTVPPSAGSIAFTSTIATPTAGGLATTTASPTSATDEDTQDTPPPKFPHIVIFLLIVALVVILGVILVRHRRRRRLKAATQSGNGNGKPGDDGTNASTPGATPGASSGLMDASGFPLNGAVLVNATTTPPPSSQPYGHDSDGMSGMSGMSGRASATSATSSASAASAATAVITPSIHTRHRGDRRRRPTAVIPPANQPVPPVPTAAADADAGAGAGAGAGVGAATLSRRPSYAEVDNPWYSPVETSNQPYDESSYATPSPTPSLPHTPVAYDTFQDNAQHGRYGAHAVHPNTTQRGAAARRGDNNVNRVDAREDGGTMGGIEDTPHYYAEVDNDNDTNSSGPVYAQSVLPLPTTDHRRHHNGRGADRADIHVDEEGYAVPVPNTTLSTDARVASSQGYPNPTSLLRGQSPRTAPTPSTAHDSRPPPVSVGPTRMPLRPSTTTTTIPPPAYASCPTSVEEDGVYTGEVVMVSASMSPASPEGHPSPTLHGVAAGADARVPPPSLPVDSSPRLNDLGGPSISLDEDHYVL